MQKTWTYYKIRDVVDAASTQTLSAPELAEHLRANYDSFVYHRRDDDGNVRARPCSAHSVRGAIGFCRELGLIEEGDICTLSDLGEDSLNPLQFDLVLQQAVLDYLDRHQISYDQIKSAIEEAPVPTPRALYLRLSPALAESRFRTCLFLLSLCGQDTDQHILTGSVVKVYEASA